MTKKQKLRRNSFAADYNNKEDDFILADLDVMQDEEETSPVPLKHFLDDEEIIDRLLINSRFGANDELEEDDRESNARVIDDIDLADDFSGFDRFVVKPIEQAEQNRYTETEEIPVLAIHSMADFDERPDEEDAIDRLLVDEGFDANDELEEVDGKPDAQVIDDISPSDEFDVNIDGQNAMTTDTTDFDPEKGELVFEKEGSRILMGQEVHTETELHEQTIVETTDEIEPELDLDNLKNTGLNKLNSFKTERENIKKLINDCENKVKKAAVISYASLVFGFVALLSTIVMGVMLSSMQTKISKLSDLVSILEEDMGSIAGKNPDLEINNSDSSIEHLNQKVNGYPKRLEEQSRSSSGISEDEMTADVTKQATVNNSLDNQLAKPPLQENKKPSEAFVKKLSAEKKATNIQTAAGWSVNLTAFEDLNYAKSKAAKYVQKGIPVKVIAVEMNNKTWYRLKVGGFKNKEEATSNADKIKKSLNLNLVSVVNN